MFGLIVITVVVLVVLNKMGIFRKQWECRNCGKVLKGTEQQVFGPGNQLVLCKECAGRIHPQIMKYAKKSWSYPDYADYLAWEEETREEREQFTPDFSYGFGSELMIDTERGLFSIGSGKRGGLVFRFADLSDYELDFKPEEVKEGFLGDKVKGNEFVAVEMNRPNVYLEEVVNFGIKLRLRKKGILSNKYEYELSEKFMEVIRAFTICIYIEVNRREEEEQYQNRYQEDRNNVGEIEKALALFMFDSMSDVTEEALKKQRNALIKAFHPDNNEANEAYSQKINAAYELLRGVIRGNR